MKNDVIKAVVYDRGIKEHNGQKKHMTLVAMIVASDEPLLPKNGDTEFIMMGGCDISHELKSLKKYECPYNMGSIHHAIVDVAHMTPNSLNEIE